MATSNRSGFGCAKSVNPEKTTIYPIFTGICLSLLAKNGKLGEVVGQMMPTTNFKSSRPWFHRWFWQPQGCVPGVEWLPPWPDAVAKTDVTALVGGQETGWPALTVAELAGGKVVGDLRLATTSDDVVVGGIQLVSGCASLQELHGHHAMRRRRLRIPRYRRGTALLLSAANGDNYYHWLMESLPRWKMMQAAGWSDYDYVLVHSRSRPFQTETLDRLAVPPSKRLRLSKNCLCQFERLVVPAMPFPFRRPAAWACDWIRSVFPATGGGPERIYLSRRGERRRRLANEYELETRLNALGFVSVQPERWSVAEQARLFGSAKCVVSAHGAGLVNLVFAPKEALLVELFHPDILRPTFKNLAAAGGQQYAAVIGQKTRSETDDSQAEFTINIEEVLHILVTRGFAR